MAPMYGLLLAVKGEIKRVKIADGSTTLDQEALQRIIKKKTPLKELGNYVHAGHKITLFGWTSGKAGTENKHDLPPPLHESVVYSDILLIASKDEDSWTNPVNFTPDQYEKFYARAMGGDDAEDSSDSDEEESDSDEEEEEDEEVVKLSKKKQAAAEDGEPEDEGEESTSEDEEEEDEGEDEEEILAALEDDEGVVAPVTKRATSKKKAAAAKTNLTTVQNTGRAAQQKLLARPGFAEISAVTPIPKEGPEHIVRSHVLQLLKTKLGKFFNTKDQSRLESVILEAALQDAEKKFVVKHFENTLFKVCYMNSARRLLSNLDPASYVHNSHLLPRLRNGDLDISHLATMNNMDYAPAMYTQLHERQLLREQRQLEGNKAMATDQFRCGRCGKRETTFYELQTRSADEPMTKFITCLNCNNHWRK
jgi:DNA-directed RNA polymerase subunit M/transcription elongation factor TFIIS